MTKTLTFLFLLLPCAVFSQFSLSGRVINHDDNRPITNVNVFLNNTTIGDKTTNAGIFTLHNVKPGKYDLAISIVGFFSYSETITVNNANSTLPDIYLTPKVTVLNEVKIKPKEDTEWQRNLDLFKNEFLGTSDLVKECKIINPELLDLSYDEKTQILTAKSVDFLIIENKALGYLIKYLLSNFNYNQNAKQFLYEGSVFFEELKGTAAQKEQWKERREDIYANSITHFLHASLNNKLSQEGFLVLRFLTNPERPPDSVISQRIKIFTLLKDKHEYRDSLSFWEKKSKLPRLLPQQVPVALTGEDIIEKTNKPGLYVFGYGKDALYVIYDKSRQFKATSLSHLYTQNNTSNTLVIFNTPVTYFDNRGVIINPESLAYAGVWASKRIADLLPVNYEPLQTEPPVDSTLVKKIDGSLKDYIAGHYIEKAYLHFDKPYYAAGDTIYFKAYVTDPLYEPSTLSGVLNVELINPDNKITGSLKLKLKDGTASGDFALDDKLKKGNYRLRAYTNVMLNGGEEYFFDQYLFIINSPSKVSQPSKATHNSGDKKQTAELSQSKIASGKIDIQFFPEGGNLVNGVTSKIAFKAVAANGLGANVKGTVTDEQGHTVCSFASQHLGMGIIAITPISGKVYKVSINGLDSTKVFALPKADDRGYALNIDNSDPRNIRVHVIAGQQNRQAPINLIAQSGGIIYSYTAGKLVNNNFTAVIPKNKFPDGIVQFTLFTANGEPMNERLIFMRNPEQLNLKLVTEKPTYHPRQKVTINLLTTDKDYQPAAGNFSVAVTDETRVPVDEDNESTILSNLMLTSDLKGYVERPNYYFNGKNDKANSDLDVLMLTQGYHKFEWKQILNDKIQPAVIQPEERMSVSGIIKTSGGKAIPYGKVSLLAVSKAFFSLDTVADANGKFVFKHFPVIDSMRYVIQATDKQVRKNALIEIEKERPPKISENKNAPDGNIKESDSSTVYLDFNNNFHREQLKQGIGKHAIILKEVTIKEKKELKYVKHSSNLNGPGNANDVITADQIPPGCPIFKDCIIGHLHNIKYFNGNFYSGFFPVLVLLDGIEIPGNLKFVNFLMTKDEGAGPSQADVLNSLMPSDIASVEIITDASLAAMYGARGAGGVIIITTKRWDDMIPDGSNFKPKFAYYTPGGYYKARVFYSPRYDLQKTNTSFADLRTTIYWNPNINTDKNGNASFDFFNADTKGNYRIVIEGIDENGHLGRQVYSYKVE
jgi:TonB-dependent SusC/RagA subfamily outer membrane receptor